MRQSTAPLPRGFLPRLQTDDQRRREETLKGIHPLTICTVLVFPVVVALLWTMYNGVGGSVVRATPSASGSAFSRLGSGWLLHQSGSTQYGLVLVVHFRKESYANVVLSIGTMCSRRFMSA